MKAEFGCYENILRAVGRVLDERGARSITIAETNDDLVVRGYDALGKEIVASNFDVPELFALVQKVASADPVVSQRPATTLKKYLAERETVSARR